MDRPITRAQAQSEAPKVSPEPWPNSWAWHGRSISDAPVTACATGGGSMQSLGWSVQEPPDYQHGIHDPLQKHLWQYDRVMICHDHILLMNLCHLHFAMNDSRWLPPWPNLGNVISKDRFQAFSAKSSQLLINHKDQQLLGNICQCSTMLNVKSILTTLPFDGTSPAI